MLHHVSISNFRSILDPVELDLRVPNAVNDPVNDYCRPVPLPYPRVTPAAAIVGPNVSSKSTILDAIATTLSFAAEFATRDPDRLLELFPHHESPDGRSLPTRIRITLDAPGALSGLPSVLEYRLEISRNDTRPGVHIAETLVHTNRAPHARRTAASFRATLLKRHRQRRSIRIDPILRPPQDMQSEPLHQIPSGASAISSLAASAPSATPNVNAIAAGFRNFASTAAPPPPDAPLDIDFLRRLDLGIDADRTPPDPTVSSPLAFLGVHETLTPSAHSTGLRALVRLYANLMSALREGRVLLAPRFAHDIHPTLADELLNLFRRNTRHAQILLSTHNTELLTALDPHSVHVADPQRFTRNSTRLLRASQFPGVTGRSNLQTLYCSGRLGGIPHIG